MKLQVILSKRKGKFDRTEYLEVLGCAQSANCDYSLSEKCFPIPNYENLNDIEDAHYSSSDNFFFTDSINVHNAKEKRNDKGKYLYFEFSAPHFRDITKFYNELFDMRSFGLELAVRDSKLTDENYNYRESFNPNYKPLEDEVFEEE